MESITHEMVTVGEDEASVCINWLSESERPKLLYVTPASDEDTAAFSSTLCMENPSKTDYEGFWC